MVFFFLVDAGAVYRTRRHQYVYLTGSGGYCISTTSKEIWSRVPRTGEFAPQYDHQSLTAEPARSVSVAVGMRP